MEASLLLSLPNPALHSKIKVFKCPAASSFVFQQVHIVMHFQIRWKWQAAGVNKARMWHTTACKPESETELYSCECLLPVSVVRASYTTTCHSRSQPRTPPEIMGIQEDDTPHCCPAHLLFPINGTMVSDAVNCYLGGIHSLSIDRVQHPS